MAERPLFLPILAGPSLVQVAPIQFKWVPGMATSQAQKCIASLHTSAATSLGVHRILEISSKSTSHLGVQLSAFNLRFAMGQAREMSVEAAYQGSKVFVDGGPYVDILIASSRDAKRDPRVRGGRPLQSFRLFDEEWPLEPKSAFYDWLYVSALSENPEEAAGLLDFDAFTDIAFNPAKSVNCQARAAAIYVSLFHRGQLQKALKGKEAFLSALGSNPVQSQGQSPSTQAGLFEAPDG